MAQIDHSIYFQQKTPDIMGGVERGLSMKNMMSQQKERDAQIAKQKASDDAYKAGIVTNPDGTTSFDQKRTLSELAKVGGKEYLTAKEQFQTQDLAQQKAQREKQVYNLDLIGRLAGSATDQASYDNALSVAAQNGIDVSKMSKAYDPNIVKQYQYSALTAKEKLENELRQQEMQNKKLEFQNAQMWKGKDYELNKEKVGIQREELGIKRQESVNKSSSGEKLPIDQKKFVETLSTKNANKIAIKNQIDAVMSNWDSLSEDQKVAMGGQLLKTLNSPEGADAIGVEEANRLGSKLQFAMGNFTNSNPTQFGRDLEGFKEQAQNTSKSLGVAVQSNQDLVDETMGRSPKPVTKTWEGVTYKKIGNEWVPQ